MRPELKGDMDDLFLIHGGRVVDPASGIDGFRDVVLLDEVVFAVAQPGEGAKIAEALIKSGAVATASSFDATGLVVLPGLVDMHVHFREPSAPGAEIAETIKTGAASAVAGGYTSVATMPNTSPPVDGYEAALRQKEAGAQAGMARVWPIGALTAGRAGKEPSDVVGLARGGAVALSDDGSGVLDGGVMYQCMKAAADLGLLVSDHAEDCSISGCGVMHEGAASRRLGLPGKPRASEDAMVARDLVLAAQTGARLHVAHLSTSGAAAHVRAAKASGMDVSCEVTPHHLMLTDETVADEASAGEPKANWKMNPPLRTEKDRQDLLFAIRDGTVDVIATDHAPHPLSQKKDGKANFLAAANGVIGLETAFPTMLSLLHYTHGVDLGRLVELMSRNPARLLGIPGGTLRPGATADLVIMDIDSPFKIDANAFRSMARNTPFDGLKVMGQTVLTIVGGRAVYSREGAPIVQIHRAGA